MGRTATSEASVILAAMQDYHQLDIWQRANQISRMTYAFMQRLGVPADAHDS